MKIRFSRIEKPLMAVFLSAALFFLQGCSKESVDAPGGDLVVDSSEGIQFFEGTYSEALEEAKSQNKLVFMDFYTEWCVPCKAMVKYVFSQKAVGDVFDKHFIALKVDAENEDINGPELAERFSVMAFPTYIITDASDQMVSINTGYLNRDEFLAWTDVSISGMSIEKYSKLEEAIRSGVRDEEAVLTFLRHSEGIMGDRIYNFTKTDPSERVSAQEFRGQFEQLVNKTADEYLGNVSEGKLLTPASLQLILAHKMDASPDDKVVEFVLANHDKYLKMGNAQKLAALVIKHSLQPIVQLAAKGDASYKDQVKTMRVQYADLLTQLPEYKAFDFELPGYRLDIENIYDQGNLEGDLMLTDLQYQAATSAWDDYLSTAQELFRKYPKHRAFAIKHFETMARFAHNCDDQAVLRKSDELMRSVFVDHMETQSGGAGYAQWFQTFNVMSAYPALLAKTERRNEGEDVLDDVIDTMEDKYGDRAKELVLKLKEYKAQM